MRKTLGIVFASLGLLGLILIIVMDSLESFESSPSGSPKAIPTTVSSRTPAQTSQLATSRESPVPASKEAIAPNDVLNSLSAQDLLDRCGRPDYKETKWDVLNLFYSMPRGTPMVRFQYEPPGDLSNSSLQRISLVPYIASQEHPISATEAAKLLPCLLKGGMGRASGLASAPAPSEYFYIKPEALELLHNEVDTSWTSKCISMVSLPSGAVAYNAQAGVAALRSLRAEVYEKLTEARTKKFSSNQGADNYTADLEELTDSYANALANPDPSTPQSYLKQVCDFLPPQ